MFRRLSSKSWIPLYLRTVIFFQINPYKSTRANNLVVSTKSETKYGEKIHKSCSTLDSNPNPIRESYRVAKKDEVPVPDSPVGPIGIIYGPQ